LAQGGTFSSDKKKGKKSASFELKKEQDKLRIKIVKYFLDIYADASAWKSLIDNESFRANDNTALKQEIKNNESNIKTFQKNLYDRIINIIFKSVKSLANCKKSNDTNEQNGNSGDASLGARRDSEISNLNDIQVEKELLLKWSFNRYVKNIESLL